MNRDRFHLWLGMEMVEQLMYGKESKVAVLTAKQLKTKPKFNFDDPRLKERINNSLQTLKLTILRENQNQLLHKNIIVGIFAFRP